MIHPIFTTHPTEDVASARPSEKAIQLVAIGSDQDPNQAYYRQLAEQLDEAAQTLLDWHPLPEDGHYVRVAAVQGSARTYKLAERSAGIAVWSVADDAHLQLVMSADPNQHLQWIDPELAQEATQTFRAAAVAETIGVYLRLTQLDEWESPSKRYLMHSDVNLSGEIETLEVKVLQADQSYLPLLAVRDHEILLNQLEQDDLRQFRRFGKHLRAELLRQQYASIALVTDGPEPDRQHDRS